MSLPDEKPALPRFVHTRPAEAPWLIPLLLALMTVFVIVSPWPLLAKLRAVSRAVSVTIPSHMLVVGHETLPMNARSTGLYLGVLTGVVLLLLTGRGKANRFPPTAALALLTGTVVAMTVDGFNSVLETMHATNPALHPWYAPSNTLRVVTGTFCGLAFALLGASIVNSVLWQHTAERVAEDIEDLGGYLLVTLLVVLIILRRLPALYWPLALLSVAGFLVLATMVNLITVVVSFRRERRTTTWRQALPLILGAMVLSFGEIALIDAAHS